MAGELSREHDSYTHFNAGYDSRINPLTAVDKKILNFAVKASLQPALKTHGQILRNFGMYPPEFWTRAQRLSTHPELEDNHREQLSKIFSEPSRPGPMDGGTPIDTNNKKFNHELEW